MKGPVRIYAVVLFFIASGVFAGDTGDTGDVWWGSNYMPGNFLVGGSFGYESESDDSLSSDAGGLRIGPDAEWLLYKPVFSGISPFDFGVAGKVRTGIFFRDYGSYTSDPWFPLGVGVLGTAHMGFKGLGFHFSDYKDTPNAFFGYLGRVDYFFELGIVFDFITEPDSSDHLGITAGTGINYFINDRLTVRVGYSYWNGFGGFRVGARLKFGKSQKTKDISVNLDPLYYRLYLGRFYSMYWSSFYPGGFYMDDSNYKEGQGTVWELASKESGDVLAMEKILLKIYDDGSKWWKVKYRDGGDETVYEFLLNSRHDLVKLRFRDEHTGKIREYTVSGDEPETVSGMERMRMITDSDYHEWNTGKEKVSTEAGIFTADHLVFKDDASRYEWWVSADVPGNLVKFSWKNDSDAVSGILVRIIENGRSVLNTKF